MAGKLILVVDDEKDFLKVISSRIETWGFRVILASSGAEALLLIKDKKPDIVILDYMMPTKDGFHTCVELRQMDALKGVPIFVMTAFGQDIGELYGLHGAGETPDVQAFLEKPVEPNVLLDRIATALNAPPA